MEETDATTYARGMAGALRVLGPTPRASVLGMLRGLGLDDDGAVVVVAFGLAQGILAEDAAGMLVEDLGSTAEGRSGSGTAPHRAGPYPRGG